MEHHSFFMETNTPINDNTLYIYNIWIRLVITTDLFHPNAYCHQMDLAKTTKSIDTLEPTESMESYLLGDKKLNHANNEKN